MRYQLLEKDKNRLISLVLLNEIIQFQHYFPVVLGGEDIFLEPYLTSLRNNGLLTITKSTYTPTDKGREELVKLYDKYYEYLKMFDIYCAVDLTAGEFAFSSMLNEGTEEEWKEFLHNERFSDVRVAVADFKGINPIEIVFMSFLNENRFDCTEGRWQYNLTGDAIWNEILDICNTSIDVDYLKENGVLEDVIRKGAEIAIHLVKDAEDFLASNEETIEDEEIIEETETIEEYVDVVEMPTYGYSYWDPYYDPYYISPIWIVPIALMY